MSEDRVEGRSGDAKIVLTIVGLLCAPMVGAFASVLVTLILMHATGSASPNAGATSITLNIFFALVTGAIAGIPTSLAIGWPVHVFLQLQRATGALHYIVLGAAIACMLLPLALIPGALTSLLGLFVFGFGLAGAIGGLTFWLIRRPDRDRVS